jgi:hypothetical protein
MNSDWKQIGMLPVDAGCILLSDPCYVLPDSRGIEDGKHIEIPYDYSTMLEEMEKEGWPKEFRVKPKGYSQPLGMIVESGYGDGEYPVFAQYNREGRLAKIMIDFDYDWQDESYDEEEDY